MYKASTFCTRWRGGKVNNGGGRKVNNGGGGGLYHKGISVYWDESSGLPPIVQVSSKVFPGRLTNALLFCVNTYVPPLHCKGCIGVWLTLQLKQGKVFPENAHLGLF